MLHIIAKSCKPAHHCHCCVHFSCVLLRQNKEALQRAVSHCPYHLLPYHVRNSSRTNPKYNLIVHSTSATNYMPTMDRRDLKSLQCQQLISIRKRRQTKVSRTSSQAKVVLCHWLYPTSRCFPDKRLTIHNIPIDVKFTVLELGHVNGSNESPLYTELKAATSSGKITWNCQSRFLLI